MKKANAISISSSIKFKNNINGPKAGKWKKEGSVSNGAFLLSAMFHNGLYRGLGIGQWEQFVAHATRIAAGFKV